MIRSRFIAFGCLMCALAFAGAPAAQAQSATLTANTSTYDAAGGTVTFTSTLTYTGLTPSAYAFSVQLPAGWAFVSHSLGAGVVAAVSPSPNDNFLEWGLSSFPANQASWTFQVSYPAGLTGDQTISVPIAQYRSPPTNLTVASITLTRSVPVAPSITSQPVAVTVTVGEGVLFSVGASGTSPLSYQWKKNGGAIGGATGSTYSIGAAQTGDAGNYSVTVSNGVGSVDSQAVSLTVNQPAPEPRITSHPASQTINAGTSVTFSVGATGAAPLSYQWKKDNIAVIGATSATYTISSAQSRDSGTYTVTVWNSAASVTSNGATLTVNGGTSDAGRFYNISTRAYCTTGDRVAIGGFVIAGRTSKRVLIQAVGPTLTTQGISQADVLQDPTIELHHGAPIIGSNDNLADNANAAEIRSIAARVGATPLAAADTKSAALLLTLDPGVYSFLAKGKNDTSGIVLLEVYEAD